MCLTYKLLVLVATYGLITNGQDDQDRHCTPRKEIIRNLLAHYDNEPLEPSDLKTNVVVELWVQQIQSLNINLGQVELILYVTEKWLDKSLSYSHLNPCQTFNITTSGKILFEKVWTPKLRFINSISVNKLHPQFSEDFVMVYPNGTVWRNYRINLITPCHNVNLKTFPFFDVQCRMAIGSLIYHDDQIQLILPPDNPIIMLSNLSLPDYVLSDINARRIVQSYPGGRWDELNYDMTFRHRHGWHILHVYGPSCALVFASWISFCLGTAITARALLTFGSLLALLLQYCYAIKDIPQLSYITSLDTWMSMCVVFAVASIMELALFTLVTRSCCNTNATYGHIENETTKPLIVSEPRGKRLRTRAAIVDIIFAILFPLTFIVLAIIYWCV